MNEAQVLLLGGNDPTYHDFSRLLPILRGQLEGLGLGIVVSEDPDMLLKANIRVFDLIVSYTFGHTLSGDQELGLLEAVRGDPWDPALRTKGFIGLHGASCSFLNSEAYLRMLGGKFLVHPPLGSHTLEIIDAGHPVMQDIDKFQIEDELYLMETYAGIETLAACQYEGFLRPVIWAKAYGLGKVVYNSLGHGEKQLRDPVMQKVLANAVRWILGAGSRSI